MIFSDEMRGKLEKYFDESKLEWACSIEAINLAINGVLTDQIPDCMSEIVGNWIMLMDGAMPCKPRDSPEWKALLPQASWTGRDKEGERLAIIIDNMWCTLGGLRPLADDLGFLDEWMTMLAAKTSVAAKTANAAATDASAKSADDHFGDHLIYTAAEEGMVYATAAAHAGYAAAFAINAVTQGTLAIRYAAVDGMGNGGYYAATQATRASETAAAAFTYYAKATKYSTPADKAFEKFWAENINPVKILTELVNA